MKETRGLESIIVKAALWTEEQQSKLLALLYVFLASRLTNDNKDIRN